MDSTAWVRVDHAMSAVLVLLWLLHEFLKAKMCRLGLHCALWHSFALVVLPLFWFGLVGGAVTVLAVGFAGKSELSISAGLLTAALLSALLSNRTPEYGDKRARMIRKLLGAQKLRFGNPGKKGSSKYVITNKLRYKGGDTWDDQCTSGWGQALADWSIEHRITRSDVAIVEDSMLRGREIDMAVVGRMLRMWLPSGAAGRFDLSEYLEDNGDLAGAYGGARGSGLRVTGLSLAEWMKGEGRTRSLELWAREYENAAAALTDGLDDICLAAVDKDDTLRKFGKRLVAETRREQQTRYPNLHDWWSPEVPDTSTP